MKQEMRIEVEEARLSTHLWSLGWISCVKKGVRAEFLLNTDQIESIYHVENRAGLSSKQGPNHGPAQTFLVVQRAASVVLNVS